MMSDFKSTLKDIKSHGYWVFHLDPVRPKQNFDNNHPQLQNFVQEYRIKLRGWDFPHVPTNNNDRHAINNIDGGVAAWVNADMFKEVWRLFFDGEFIQYSGLNEDWYHTDQWVARQAPYNKIEPNTVIDIIDILYKLTEFFEFAKILAIKDFYNGDVKIKVELRNVINRQLVLLDPSRVPLHGDYTSAVDTILAFDETVSAKDLRIDSSKYALKAAMKTYHLFQWNHASSDQLASDQQKFIERRLGW
jgi:hypothetical protein